MVPPDFLLPSNGVMFTIRFSLSKLGEMLVINLLICKFEPDTIPSLAPSLAELLMVRYEFNINPNSKIPIISSSNTGSKIANSTRACPFSFLKVLMLITSVMFESLELKC